MKVYHKADRKQLEQGLLSAGCYSPALPIPFASCNALAAAGMLPCNENEVWIEIDTENTSVPFTWQTLHGIKMPFVRAPLKENQFRMVDALPERVNILMNTSIIDDAWCFSALRPWLHGDDVVCVLAFSFFDDTKNIDDWNRQYRKGQGIWYRANTDVFARFGIPERNVHWVNYFEDSREKMISSIVNSTVLLLTGGAPDLMMKRIREKRLQKYLRKYQGTIIGYSAGAMVQLEDYHIIPDEDYDTFSWQKGLGYMNGFDIEVHYAASPHQKSWVAEVLSQKKRPVYCIYEKGGLIVVHDQVTCFGRVDLEEQKSV